MKQNSDVSSMIDDLYRNRLIRNTVKVISTMSGTTSGSVFALSDNNKPQYVLKLDDPQQITLVEQLLRTYEHTHLLPKLLYTDPGKQFVLYA